MPEAASEPEAEPVFGSVDETSVPNSCPFSMRDRELPKWLEWFAINGLYKGGPDLGTVAYEFARHLVWIELYENEDKIALAQELITNWAIAKHNGQCRRIISGKYEDVVSQIGRCIESIASIRDANALEHYALTRQRRANGAYRRNIDIAPYMTANPDNPLLVLPSSSIYIRGV